MFFKNVSSKTLKLKLSVNGYDDYEELIGPGQTSSMWVNVDDYDVVEISIGGDKDGN